MSDSTRKERSLTEQWFEFLESLPVADAPVSPYPAEQFGDSPAMADSLAKLIYDGQKTATCSAIWEWEHDKQPLPVPGDRSIVLDGSDSAVCIVETTEVSVRPYSAVDQAFAHDEGEDDRTLASWREKHWSFFSRVLPEIGRAPSPDMPLLCERFKVIYKW